MKVSIPACPPVTLWPLCHFVTQVVPGPPLHSARAALTFIQVLIHPSSNHHPLSCVPRGLKYKFPCSPLWLNRKWIWFSFTHQLLNVYFFLEHSSGHFLPHCTELWKNFLLYPCAFHSLIPKLLLGLENILSIILDWNLEEALWFYLVYSCHGDEIFLKLFLRAVIYIFY